MKYRGSNAQPKFTHGDKVKCSYGIGIIMHRYEVKSSISPWEYGILIDADSNNMPLSDSVFLRVGEASLFI